MGDGMIKDLFESLEAEPRPEFIADLRRRVEQQWSRETAPAFARRQSVDTAVSLELEAVRDPDRSARRRERRWKVTAVLGAAATLLAGLIVVVRTGEEVTLVDTAATTGPATSVPSVSGLPAVEELGERLRATIPVENTADSIAFTDDAVWVSGWDGDKVSRIDARTNEVITVDVGFSGTRVAAGDRGVWVGVDGGRLLRLDPDTGDVIATIEITPGSYGGSAPTPLVGDEAVWVHDPAQGALLQIDPQTNEVAATIDLAASGVEADEGMVMADEMIWLNTCEGPVSIDAEISTISEPIALDGCANSIGFIDGSLWVGLPGQRTARIDPVERKVEVIVNVGPDDDAPFLSTGEGAVWRPLTTNTIARIDIATNTVTEILDLQRGQQVAGFEVGHGSLWAGDYANRTMLRIDP